VSTETLNLNPTSFSACTPVLKQGMKKHLFIQKHLN